MSIPKFCRDCAADQWGISRKLDSPDFRIFLERELVYYVA